MSSTNPADDPRICPRCNEPIKPEDKEWHSVDGLVHERCVPKETRTKVLKSLETADAEAAKLLAGRAFGKLGLGGPKIKLGNIVLAKPEFFEPAAWTCRKCRDTGLRETKPDEKGYTRAYECECSKRRRAGARVRALENSYPLFEGITFKTYKPKHYTQAEALKRCREYVKRWPLVDGRGLLLYGPPGVGKTGLIKCIAVEAVKKASTEILWYRATEIALLLRGTFDRESDERENVFIKSLGDAELLLLDDLGREKVSAYNESVFFEFLERRHAGKSPTLITTNLEDATAEEPGPDGRRRILPSLRHRLGGALYSRLNEMCDFVHVNGKDRRIRK